MAAAEIDQGIIHMAYYHVMFRMAPKLKTSEALTGRC